MVQFVQCIPPYEKARKKSLLGEMHSWGQALSDFTPAQKAASLVCQQGRRGRLTPAGDGAWLENAFSYRLGLNLPSFTAKSSSV